MYTSAKHLQSRQTADKIKYKCKYNMYEISQEYNDNMHVKSRQHNS